MKMTSSLIAIAFAASGCAHEVGLPDFYPEETTAKFGVAVQQNIAAQTVNPDAPGDAVLTGSGIRTATAVERYEEDGVEKPTSSSTLRVTSSSSSGDQ